MSCVHHIAITELAAMFFAQPSQLSDLHNFYTTDPTTSILLAELALHSPLDQYTLLNGIIRYKQRICLDILPTFSTVKWYYLLQTMHLLGTFYPPSACIPLSLTFQWCQCPSSYETTYHRGKLSLLSLRWRTPSRNLWSLVPYANRSKPDVFLPLGCCPASHSRRRLASQHTAFHRGSSRYHHYNSISVVVDKFSRYAHFIPLSHSFSAFQVVPYMNNVFKLHGY